MKKIAVTFVLVLFSLSQLSAQGTIQFLNSALSKVKYCPDMSGIFVSAPTGTKIGLFWGTNPTEMVGRGQGTLVTPTATIGAVAGIWNGGAVYPIPGTEPGQAIWLKIAGWNAGVGDDFRQADLYGESAVVRVILGPTAGPGTVVWQVTGGTATDRAKPFNIANLAGCPEPSFLALGLVAGGLFLFRRATHRERNEPG